MDSRAEGHRRTKVATIWIAGASLAGTAIVGVTTFVQHAASAGNSTTTGPDTGTGGDLSPYNPGGTGFSDPGPLTDGGRGAGPQAHTAGS